MTTKKREQKRGNRFLMVIGSNDCVNYYMKKYFLLFNIFKRKLYEYNKTGRSLIFGLLMASIIFWIDFLTYTNMYTRTVIYIPFFLALGQIINKNKVIYKYDK